jgi:hypothetical protein
MPKGHKNGNRNEFEWGTGTVLTVLSIRHTLLLTSESLKKPTGRNVGDVLRSLCFVGHGNSFRKAVLIVLFSSTLPPLCWFLLFTNRFNYFSNRYRRLDAG